MALSSGCGPEASTAHLKIQTLRFTGYGPAQLPQRVHEHTLLRGLMRYTARKGLVHAFAFELAYHTVFAHIAAHAIVHRLARIVFIVHELQIHQAIDRSFDHLRVVSTVGQFYTQSACGACGSVQ